MLRSLCILTILAASLQATSIARGQNRTADEERPSLGERLEQFGRDLFGGADTQSMPAPSRSANRKFLSPDRTATADRRNSDLPAPADARSIRPTQPHPDQTTSRRRSAIEAPTARTTDASRSAVTVHDDAPPRPPQNETMPAVRRPSQSVTPDTVQPRMTAPPRTGSIPLRRSETDEARVRLSDEPRITKTPSAARNEISSPAELSPSRAGRSLQERLAAAREIRPMGDTEQDTAGPSSATQPTQPKNEPTPATPYVAQEPTPAALREAQSNTESAADITQPSAAEPTAAPVVAAQPEAKPTVEPESTSLVEPIAPRADVTNAPAAPSTNLAAGPGANVLVARQSPVIGVETAGPRSIKIGEPANFRVVMRNAGQVAGEGVVAEVQIPEWTEVVSTRASRGSSRVVQGSGQQLLVEWSLGSLAAQGQESLDLQIVPRKSEPFDLAVQWKHSPIMSQTVVEVQEPKLELKVKGPDETLYGREETYELVISNPGTGDAENIVVRLVAAGPTEENAATHPVGTVKAGETKVVEIELTAREAGEFWIKADGAGDGGLTASTAEMVLVRRAELEVEITGPQFQYAGTPADYRILVTNPGNAPARDVEVKTNLPAELRHLASSERGRVDVQPGQLVWSITGLPAGEQREFTLKCELTAPGQWQPEVVCRAADDLEASATVTTTVEALADLVLEISDPPGPTPIGVEAVYEVRIHNRGTTGAQQIDLAAFFSEGIEPVSASPVENQVASGQVIFNTIPELGAGETIVLEVRAQAETSGNHAFRAELTCEPLGTKLAAQEMTRFYDSGQATR